MRYGRSVPDGFLPVFSVPTEKDAEDLLLLACPTNGRGEFIAPELAREQTFENLAAFSDRLEQAWQTMRKVPGPFPVESPSFVREHFPAEKLHDEGEVRTALGWLADCLQAGASGAYRVCAKNLARRVNMDLEWKQICRERGMRVL